MSAEPIPPVEAAWLTIRDVVVIPTEPFELRWMRAAIRSYLVNRLLEPDVVEDINLSRALAHVILDLDRAP